MARPLMKKTKHVYKSPFHYIFQRILNGFAVADMPPKPLWVMHVNRFACNVKIPVSEDFFFWIKTRLEIVFQQAEILKFILKFFRISFLALRNIGIDNHHLACFGL